MNERLPDLPAWITELFEVKHPRLLEAYPGEIELQTGGLPHNVVFARPELSQSGDVMDGVGLRFAGHGSVWVMSFASLEKLYLAAKEKRAGETVKCPDCGHPNARAHYCYPPSRTI